MFLFLSFGYLVLGEAVFCAALWGGPRGKELKPPVSELGRGSFSPPLVFRDCSLGQLLDCNLARDPEPCLNAHRNDKAKRGDGRRGVFKKMRDYLITGRRISSIFFPS